MRISAVRPLKSGIIASAELSEMILKQKRAEKNGETGVNNNKRRDWRADEIACNGA